MSWCVPDGGEQHLGMLKCIGAVTVNQLCPHACTRQTQSLSTCDESCYVSCQWQVSCLH